MSKAGDDILIVEDDPEVNELVSAYARIAGFRSRSVMTGVAALREAREHTPDLILLDVMLPDVDGFEVCRQLKSAAQTAAVPVIMLTALDREDARERGFRCGAQAYITKPFDPDDLMAKMREAAASNGHLADAARRKSGV